MIEKGLNKLTATRLRTVLFVSIIGTLVLIGAGFYFIQDQLYNFAVQVSHTNEDAMTSRDDIATFEKLKQNLEDDATNVERTKSIVADSKAYEYQDQIIKDLNTYASRSGLTIASFTFANATAPGTAGAATAAKPVAAISGLKSTTASIVLATPTKYNNVMKFIHSIEQNLTKMQLAGISLAKGSAADEVSINALDIEVYIK